MTFWELYKAIARETGYPQALVRNILIAEIKVIVEELLSDREHATLSIKGFVEVRVQKRHYRMYSNHTKSMREFDRWVVLISPQKRLKQVINGDVKLHDLTVGHNIPLYPEEYYKTHERKKSKKALNEFFEAIPAEYKVVDVNRAKRKKLKKKVKKQQMMDIRNKLPQED